MVGDAAFLSKVSGPFDLIFQDGDKPLYKPMLDALVGSFGPAACSSPITCCGTAKCRGFHSPRRHDAASALALREYPVGWPPRLAC